MFLYICVNFFKIMLMDILLEIKWCMLNRSIWWFFLSFIKLILNSGVFVKLNFWMNEVIIVLFEWLFFLIILMLKLMLLWIFCFGVLFLRINDVFRDLWWWINFWNVCFSFWIFKGFFKIVVVGMLYLIFVFLNWLMI